MKAIWFNTAKSVRISHYSSIVYFKFRYRQEIPDSTTTIIFDAVETIKVYSLIVNLIVRLVWIIDVCQITTIFLQSVKT